MKCSEAVEWMHRYIDHDLSEEESSALFEHIQSCRDCEEEFAMLKELSAQLEELPVLAPRYSLVDAILPQLEALDLGRREEGSASEEIPAATMAAAPVNRRRERTSGRSRAYRTGAFGLAAAVILGVFIYQVEPRTVRDAEIASYSVMDTSENSASLESSTQDIAQSSDAQNMTAGSEQEEAAQDATSTDPESEASDNKSASSDERSTADSSPIAGSDHSTGAAPEQPDSPASNQKSPSSSSGQKSTGQENERSANKEDTSAGDRAGGSDGAVSDESAADAPLLQKNDGITEQESDVQDERIMMGISGFAMLNEWPSPDGLFLVKYLDEHLYLFRNESDSSTVVTDLPVEGDWISGEWSEDGTVFTYIVEKDGVSASYTLQPVR